MKWSNGTAALVFFVFTLNNVVSVIDKPTGLRIAALVIVAVAFGMALIEWLNERAGK